MPTINNIFWPRWDTFEVFKFDIKLKKWNSIKNIKPQSKFLFFSSVSHLPNNEGMIILGGSDSEDNFSKRATLFS